MMLWVLINTINVYYKKADANAKSRTVAPYTTPDGTSVPEASQALFLVGATSIPAVKAGTTTPIYGCKGNPIDLPQLKSNSNSNK